MPSNWTTPKDWAYKEAPSSTSFNEQLRDNLNYLNEYKVLAQNRQNNTTNTNVTNQRICTGWGWIQGDSLHDNLSEIITFPITFDNKPVVLITGIGIKVGSNPSDIGDSSDTGGGSKMIWEARDIYTTRFLSSVTLRDGGNLEATIRFMYSWVAIGTKA